MEFERFRDFDEFAESVRDVDAQRLVRNPTHRSWEINHLDLPQVHVQQHSARNAAHDFYSNERLSPYQSGAMSASSRLRGVACGATALLLSVTSTALADEAGECAGFNVLICNLTEG